MFFLDRSFFHFVTIHAFDRQTDGQTDSFLIDRVCIPCSAVKMSLCLCNGHLPVLASRPTQILRLHWVHIPTVIEDILLQPVLACCSALDVYDYVLYKSTFYLLTYLVRW